MSRPSSFNVGPRAGPADPVWRMLIIFGGLAALVLAFPALLVGLLAWRITQKQSWSTLCWLVLSAVSVVLLVLLWTHGLAQLASAQLAELLQNIQHFHAHLSRWNWRSLWLRTWPLWLQSVLLVPLVALWGDLVSARAGGASRLLARQEEATQRHRAWAHRRAARQARNPGRLPDAVGEQMVIGIAIAEDEMQE